MERRYRIPHHSLRRPVSLPPRHRRRPRRRRCSILLHRLRPFFDRDGIYGDANGEFGDNLERFSLFSRAVLEASKILGVPDVFHAHDWHTALIPLLLRTAYYDDPALSPAASVFTIHNMGYQGIFDPIKLPQIVLPQWIYAPDRLEHFGAVNLMKGGLVYADHITAVSHRYMEEIRTPEHGFGLDGVVRSRGADASGIVNGVDYEHWDPAIDPHIAARYTPEDIARGDLSAKRACKLDLLREFDLPGDGSAPLIGIVSRFALQKGFDLIAAAADQLVHEPLQMVVLGSGDQHYEDLFRALARYNPAKFAVRIAYNNALAHKIEAGADMFLMPSRYEPCGLNQIYSLKYGTPPIVRATGGLDDTVQNWDPATHHGTGFKFWDYRAHSMLETIRWALKTYAHPDAWRQLMLNGMAQNYSWPRAAEQYDRIYHHVRGLRHYLTGR